MPIYNYIFAQNGVVRSYYPDGSIYYELSYVNDVLDGTSYWYYQNGNLKMIKEYSKGKLNGYVKEFYENGLLKEEYYVKEGILNGTQRIFYENGALKEINIYEDGKLINSNQFDYDSLFTPPLEAYLAGNKQQELLKKNKQELICDVDICPVPIGGFKVIQDNLIYPEHALLYGLEGEVILIATVNNKGDVINTEIIKGLGLGCNEAAEEAVKKTKFIPGQKNGIVVTSRVTLKVEFKIFERSLTITNNELETNKLKDDTNNRTSEKFNSKKNKMQELERDTRIDSLFVTKSSKKKTEIICEFEECPYPVGGLRSINDHLVIPSIAKRLKLEGDIQLEVFIDKNGIVRDTKVLKGIGYGCNEAVESALMQTKFNPARNKGKEVDATVTIIFPFSYVD